MLLQSRNRDAKYLPAQVVSPDDQIYLNRQDESTVKFFITNQRYFVIIGVALLTVISLISATEVNSWFWVPAIIFGALLLVGLRDLHQNKHSILRNYPISAHIRFILESFRPEIRQYLLESDQDQIPFSRQSRGLVYQRAKGAEDKRPFGTIEDVYKSGYAWLTHSVAPTKISDSDFRVRVGGPNCKQPYHASLYNISAMSFGSLSGNAILALNKGAKKGGFAHDTGEGSISRYHREGGGDLI